MSLETINRNAFKNVGLNNEKLLSVDLTKCEKL